MGQRGLIKMYGTRKIGTGPSKRSRKYKVRNRKSTELVLFKAHLVRIPAYYLLVWTESIDLSGSI